MAANLLGSGWSAVMGLAFVPVYIKLMGVEAYGIVGVYLSLQAMFAILDLGLSQVLARELARLSGGVGDEKRAVDTVKTFEVIYLCLAVVVFLCIHMLSGYIASDWLKPKSISPQEVEFALSVMAFAIAARWPISLYMGGFGGLQKHVHLNLIVAFFATVQSLGVLVVLCFLSPTISAFLAWQALAAFLQLLVMRHVFWKLLPDVTATFSPTILKDVWRFAAGMTGVALLGTLLSQMDKILLSRILTLEDFGYYVFASTVAAVLFRLIGPIFSTYLPRITQLVASGDQARLGATYHQASQIMALTVIPIAAILAAYSSEVVLLWSGNSSLASGTGTLITLLVVGNFLNGMVNIPYALQLANGWTSLALVQNIVAVVFLGPAIYICVAKWGAVGAAAVWVGLNLIYVLVSVQIMHVRLLSEEKWRWYLESLIAPSIAAVFVVILFRALAPSSGSRVIEFFVLAVAGLSCIFCVALVLPVSRALMFQRILRFGR